MLLNYGYDFPPDFLNRLPKHILTQLGYFDEPPPAAGGTDDFEDPDQGLVGTPGLMGENFQDFTDWSKDQEAAWHSAANEEIATAYADDMVAANYPSHDIDWFGQSPDKSLDQYFDNPANVVSSLLGPLPASSLIAGMGPKMTGLLGRDYALQSMDPDDMGFNRGTYDDLSYTVGPGFLGGRTISGPGAMTVDMHDRALNAYLAGLTNEQVEDMIGSGGVDQSSTGGIGGLSAQQGMGWISGIEGGDGPGMDSTGGFGVGDSMGGHY